MSEVVVSEVTSLKRLATAFVLASAIQVMPLPLECLILSDNLASRSAR